MSVSIITPQGPVEVPVRGGGINLELLAKLQALEDQVSGLRQELSEVKASRAGNDYGLVKLSSSQSITNSVGLALPASENNAGISGSLRQNIVSLWEKANSYAAKTPAIAWNGDVINTNIGIQHFHRLGNLAFLYKELRCTKSYEARTYYKIGTFNNYKPKADTPLLMKTLQVNAWGDYVFHAVVQRNGEIKFSASANCWDMVMAIVGIWEFS